MPSARQSTASAKKDFFVSRNKADVTWAKWIAWQLEAVKYTTILQDWDFRGGQNFPLKMHEALINSGRTIGVMSPAFLKSEFTAPEWAAAFRDDPTGARGKFIPIKVRACDPEGLLGSLIWIDLIGLNELDAKEALLAGVGHGRSKPAAAPPFPGPLGRPKPVFPGRATTASPRTTVAKPKPTTRSPASSPVVTMTAKAAAERFEQHQWGVSHDRNRTGLSNTWLGVVLVPGRQELPYIDVLKFGDNGVQKKLRDLTLVGSCSVLRSDHATKTKEEVDHLSFTQTDEGTNGLAATIEIYPDGILIYRTMLDGRSSKSMRSLADGQIIDENMVRNAVAAFIRFGNGFYKHQRRDPGTAYLGASLTGIQMKFFGQPPTMELRSFTFASHRLEDPLHVPNAPLPLAVTQRRTPEATAKTIVDHFARRFRVQNAYYPRPEGS